MYRDRLWLKSFIVSYNTPEETNAAFRQYIANGMTDLRLLADLPTQSGIDPDHPFAWNSMMCGGVATYSLNVYEKMLQGLPLENVVYELAHCGISNFIYFYSLLVTLMENKGLDITQLRGNSINDPVRAKLVYACPDFPTGLPGSYRVFSPPYAKMATIRPQRCRSLPGRDGCRKRVGWMSGCGHRHLPGFA
jgi:methylmalonyl-CoA mutase N-terminal domain/subunit